MGVTDALRLGIDVGRTKELVQEWARRVGYAHPASAAVIGEAGASSGDAAAGAGVVAADGS